MRSKFIESFPESHGNGMKIVVIDTGLCKINLPSLKTEEEYSVEPVDDHFEVCKISDQESVDFIGHGTAVTSCIYKVVSNAAFIIINAFGEKEEISVKKLLCALEFIDGSINCDIVHISSGVVSARDLDELRYICNKLTKHGKILVSAMDNFGAISYPAAFPNVIGVDISVNCTSIYDYEYVDSDCINVRGRGVSQRLPWIENINKNVLGSSFSAGYITGIIAILMENGYRTLEEIKEKLKEFAKISHVPSVYIAPERPFQIHKAIVIPFNKEMHILVSKCSQVNFEIQDVYTFKHTGQIRKSISEILNRSIDKDFIVKNYDKIEWNDDFDTVILGHLAEMENILHRKVKCEVLKKCLQYNKNIYCLDKEEIDLTVQQKFHAKNLSIFYPKFTIDNLPKGIFGRMHIISTPVLGIFGTSSIQGKFNLQMELKRKLVAQGFLVGHLSTEATGYLLGSDAVYPFGYASTVETNGVDAVVAINTLMHSIEIEKEPDIIIVGSQSLSIPSSCGNISHYPCSQTELLFSIDADSIILCINYTDEIEYIKRTIMFLESANDSKVLALALFPCRRRDAYSVFDNQMYPISNVDLEEKRREVSDLLNIPVYIQSNEDEMNELKDTIIKYFS